MKPLLAALIRPAGFLLLLAAAHAAGPEWKQLKVGMSRAETLKYLGQPLIRTKARGFERWIYDGSGEVFFTGGPVRFWTVPNPTPESDAKPVEEDVMFRPRPGPRFPPTYQAPPVTTEPASADGTRFRYR